MEFKTDNTTDIQVNCVYCSVTLSSLDLGPKETVITTPQTKLMTESWTTANVWLPMRITPMLIKFNNHSWATHDETYMCNVTHVVWATVYLDGRSCHQKIKTTALHSLPWNSVQDIVCVYQTICNLSRSFQRQSNHWHGWILIAPALCHASSVNCIFLITHILHEAVYSELSTN